MASDVDFPPKGVTPCSSLKRKMQLSISAAFISIFQHLTQLTEAMSDIVWRLSHHSVMMILFIKEMDIKTTKFTEPLITNFFPVSSTLKTYKVNLKDEVL